MTRKIAIFMQMLLLAATWAAAATPEGKPAVPVRPEDEAPFAADSGCGPAQGISSLTAVGKLPPVRTMVFDPLSNSFGFVAPCAEQSSKVGGVDAAELRNRDFLDSRRLALTTQKLRLLIMPYNPDDGELALEVSLGNGIEFEITPTGGGASTRAAAMKDAEKKVVPQVKAPQAPEAVPSVRDKAKELFENSRPTSTSVPPAEQSVQESVQDYLIDASQSREDVPETSDLDLAKERARREKEERERDFTLRSLGRVQEGFSQFRKLVAETSRSLRKGATMASRIEGRIADQSQDISNAMAEHPLRLAVDATFSEVLEVARARTRAAQSVQFKSCYKGSKSFDEDLTRLRADLDVVLSLLVHMPDLKEGLKEDLQILSGRPSPSSEIPAKAWSSLLEGYKDALSHLDEPRLEFEKITDTTHARIPELQSQEKRVLALLTSPAVELERVNFSPLEDNQAVTFKARRGEKRTDDGDLTIIPSRVNSWTVKSAPVQTVRFGTGIVASYLERPVFKLGPEITRTMGEGDAAQEVMTKQVLLQDQGDGEVLPVLFVHHYWGRRSPLLSRTTFERYMPTLSLGIPLAKADPLQEVLLGLNWEMVAGFELNLGVHFGKVKALDSNVKFGDRELRLGDEVPSNVALADLEKERFKPDFYIGVVLTSETYRRLFDARETEN